MEGLANKMRPQKFEEVIGQEVTIKILKESIQSGKAGSVFFFSGPAGIGKTTISRLVAKALNCDHIDNELICDKCNNCVTIKEATSDLVLEIDAATNRGIAEVNAIQDVSRRMPPAGKHKVIIIDEVHGLTPQAFEALLKTLEEPPKNVHFILCTTLPFKVPDTIRSRGLQFHFKSVTDTDLDKILISWKLSDNVKELVRRKSKGNVRDMYFMLEQLESCSNLSEQELMELLGVIGNQDIKKLVISIENGWQQYIAEVEVLKQKYEVNVVANLVKDILHDCCLVKISPELKSNSGLPLSDFVKLASTISEEGLKKALWELMDIYETSKNLDIALDLIPFFLTSNGNKNPFHSSVLSNPTPTPSGGESGTVSFIKNQEIPTTKLAFRPGRGNSAAQQTAKPEILPFWKTIIEELEGTDIKIIGG